MVRALESEEANAGLYQGLKPGHSSEHDSDFGGSKFGWSSTYDTQQYNADMLRAHKLALSSRTFGSENTGEFGGNPQYSSESEGGVDGSHSNRSIGEPLIKTKDPGSLSGRSLSGRSGQRSRTIIPPGRSRMGEGFSGSPPRRDPPPRSGPLRSGPLRSGPLRSGPLRSGPLQSGRLSELPVQVENSKSDLISEPLPPPQTSSEEFAPADSTSSGEHLPINDHLGDGR